MACKMNNSTVYTLDSAQTIDFKDYGGPREVNAHDIKIWARWYVARGEDDTELTFHIINNTDIDYDVYGMCFYSNGEYVDEDGCEVPAGGNVTYAWPYNVVTGGSSGYFSFDFTPTTNKNSRPLHFVLPFSRYDEPESTTSTSALLWE